MLKEEQKLQKRYVAHKATVKGILESEYRKVEGFDSNYLDVGGNEVSRINIIGVVLEKADNGSYKDAVIDDGTGRISARIFDNEASVGKIEVGDFAIVIGRPREFSGERYILVEIMKKIDGRWMKARKLELGSDDKVHEKPAYEKTEAITPKDRMIMTIKKMDDGNGAAIEDVSGDEDSDRLVQLLLKEGEIFEVKPGRLKVLE